MMSAINNSGNSDSDTDILAGSIDADGDSNSSPLHHEIAKPEHVPLLSESSEGESIYHP